MVHRVAFRCLALLASVVACTDRPNHGRPLGALCEASEQCESGLCYAGACLDPEGDADGDGLASGLELSLGLDPLDADSDGDAKPDGVEVGPDTTRPLDSDGDGKIDARESASADVDQDCIPDERDPADQAPDPSACPEVQVAFAEPSDWYTSEAGKAVTVALTLAEAPPVDVTLALDGGIEGAVTPASVTFTPDTWNVFQTIAVTGLDDALGDGHVDYEVTARVTSKLTRGGGTLSLVNADNDRMATTPTADDFASQRTPGLWADDPTQRATAAIRDGQLEMKADARGVRGPVGAGLGVDADLAVLRRFAGDVTVTAVEGQTGGVSGVLRLVFQDPLYRGSSRQGTIGLDVSVGRDSPTAPLVATAAIWSCANVTCTTHYATPPIVAQDGGLLMIPTAVGARHHLEVAIDPAARAVTWTVDARVFTADWSTFPVLDFSWLARAELGAFALGEAAAPAATLDLQVAVAFDDIAVDGAPWDDFDRGRLADARWLGPLLATSIVDGAFVASAQGDTSYFDTGLAFAAPETIAGFAATATLIVVADPTGPTGPAGAPSSRASAAAAGNALARAGGYFGRGEVLVPGGDPARGDVLAELAIYSGRVVAFVGSPAGSWIGDHGRAVIGVPRRLLVYWDGRDFTLQVDDAPLLYRPAHDGLTLIGPPRTARKWLSVQGHPTDRLTTLITATFDDVAIIPAL